jgi:hypothetical protein
MLIYHVGMYDVQKKKINTILCLPERRRDPKRTTKPFIDRWIKSLMGAEWWAENWAKVSILKKRIDVKETVEE